MKDTNESSTSYPSKKRNLFPLNHLLIFQSRLASGHSVKLWRLQQSRQHRETEICQLVESCQSEIRRTLALFFANCESKVAPFVDALLAGQKSSSLANFHNAVLPQDEIEILIKDIRRYVQQETQRYFGVSRLANVARYPWQKNDVQYIACLIREYRRTVLATEVAAKLGNKACQEGLCALKIPSFAVEVLDTFGLVSAFLGLFDCHPRRSRAQRRQVLIAQVSGLLRNVHWYISTDACHVAARNFYELYDLIWEPHFEKEAPKTAAIIEDGLVSQVAFQHMAV